MSQSLAERLGARFRFPLRAAIVDTPGYSTPALVPSHLPYGYEFSIAVARTLTTAEAAFRPDAFAGYLVRALDAGVHDRPLGWRVADEEAQRMGVHVHFTVNGAPCSLAQLFEGHDPWRSVEIVCGRRLAPAADEADLEEGLLAAASTCLTFVLAGLDHVLEVDDISPLGVLEGAPTEVVSVRYERSPANRSLCLAHHGYRCKVCGFDFGARYGPPGEGLIEVHHLTPLALSDGPVAVDPVRDLVPLCGNCHRMVHRVSPPYSPDEVRVMLMATGGLPEP